jgi:large subunit ribosomal protein LX
MWKFEGKMKMGKKWTKFTKEIEAPSKERALEILYSDLGSKHHVKRRNIVVEKVEEA